MNINESSVIDPKTFIVHSFIVDMSAHRTLIASCPEFVFFLKIILVSFVLIS